MRKFLPLGEPFGGVTLSYVERGPDTGRAVLCVHGLTRNAHDFDALAEVLAARGRRVIAVDVVGRGQSDWLADPAGYAVPNYAAHLLRLLDRLDLGAVDWVGTSMGGLIGMTVAAGETSPIQRLVLNDIGPYVPKAALALIRDYLGLDLVFPSLEALEGHLRVIHAGFGSLRDEEWRALARHSAKETPQGWRLGYDPRIREPFAVAADEDIDLWAAWDRIACPTFVVHGVDSPLLTAAVLNEMQTRGPRAEVASFPGIGHAPALNTSEQIDTIVRWLEP